MRFFGILGVSAAASCAVLFSSACGDDKAGTIVNEDISWHARCPGGGCSQYAAHVQAAVDQNFKVSCSRSKTTGLNITISDPGFAGDAMESARPPASLVLANSDPATQACNVTVYEKADYRDAAAATLRGSCAASGGDCVLTGGPEAGWDFVGTLLCEGLASNATGSAAKYRLEIGAGADPQAPIKIAVDNCD